MDAFFWITTIGKVALIAGLMLNVVPVMVWVERRGSALIQNRLGPNRIGPLGLLQGIADAIKMMFKEDLIPAHVNKFYYTFAPIACLIPAYMTFAVIPFAGGLTIGDRTLQFQIANLDVGIIYSLAITSLGVYGIIMGSWSSNNKYALLGGLRSSAQMISYELSMGVAVAAIVMIFSSVNLQDIAKAQGAFWSIPLGQFATLSIPKWGVFLQPLGFLIFLTTVFAETNRLPFDLPEGESEIVAGYHLEYNSMKFGVFMMAEYMNMATGAAVITTLYFGGWQMLPGMSWLLGATGLAGLPLDLLRTGFEFASFCLKVAFFLWFFVWVRWTIPRFRYDQLMDFGWKFLLPLSLFNLLATGALIYMKVL